MLKFFTRLFRPNLPPVTTGTVLYGDFPGYKTWFTSPEVPHEVASHCHRIATKPVPKSGLSLHDEAEFAAQCGMPLVPLTCKTSRGTMEGFAWIHPGTEGRDSVAVLLTFGSRRDLLNQIVVRGLLDFRGWEGKLYHQKASQGTQRYAIVEAARPLMDYERRELTKEHHDLVAYYLEGVITEEL